MRKEERGTIMGTSLRSSLGFSGFGCLWAKQSRNPSLWQRQRKENSTVVVVTVVRLVAGWSE